MSDSHAIAQAGLQTSTPGSAAPIGIFDSGLGGLTVARALIDQLPNDQVVGIRVGFLIEQDAPFLLRDRAPVVLYLRSIR